MDGQIKVFSKQLVMHHSEKLHINAVKQLLLCVFLFSGNFEQTSDRDERVICYIVNSAEYCHKTVGFFYLFHPLDNE